MLMNCATEYYNVIHVHMRKQFQANQLLIHEKKMLERARCLGEPKEHDLEFKQPPLAVECCTMLVLRVNFDLMIALL